MAHPLLYKPLVAAKQTNTEERASHAAHLAAGIHIFHQPPPNRPSFKGACQIVRFEPKYWSVQPCRPVRQRVPSCAPQDMCRGSRVREPIHMGEVGGVSVDVFPLWLVCD